MGKVDISLRVACAGHDVTRYVTACNVTQGARQLHREFTLTLAGMPFIPNTGKWDIYAGYGGTGEVLIRQGIIPPDWQPTITVGPIAEVPTMQVQGVDWAWLAARVRHTNTLVIAPNRKQARRAVEIFEDHRGEDRPTGRVTYLRAETMHAAITQLGAVAGFAVAPLMPDYELQGHVCDPSLSVWEAIWELASVFAPTAYFRRERNEVVLGDRPLIAAATSRTILGSGILQALNIEPIRDGYYRRVLVRMPEWENASDTQGTTTRTGGV